MSQVIRSPKMYDVCVIGSGAGGGTAAKVLTEGGLNVALLEAGPPVTPEKDFKMLMWPYELPHRGIGVGGHAAENFGEFLAQTAPGTSRANRIPPRRDQTSSGSDRASLAAARITGAASRSVSPPSISNPGRGTVWATIGRSLTRTWRLITTKWNPTSVSSALARTFRALPMECFSRRRNRAARISSSRKPATRSELFVSLRGLQS